MFESIAPLLSARLLLHPVTADDYLYFVSDLSGRMSLYRTALEGGDPEPLIPGDIALGNPKLVNGELFTVFADLDMILLMVDSDGDENYQPCSVPLSGGIPKPIFRNRFEGQQVNLIWSESQRHLAVFNVDPRVSPDYGSYIWNAETDELLDLGTSVYGNYTVGIDDPLDRVVVADGYSAADTVLYVWDRSTSSRTVLAGTPLEERTPDGSVPLTGFGACYFRKGGILTVTTLFNDAGGCGWIPLDGLRHVEPVSITGLHHSGNGELDELIHLDGDRFMLGYNIDGCSWAYEAIFDEPELRLTVTDVLWGEGRLHDGVAAEFSYDRERDTFALAFSTATSPVQLFTVDGDNVTQHTSERLSGVPAELLSPGEDASFTSFDGLRVSARLYMPKGDFEGPRPVAYYVHGGPQSQERPDFTWFSMPLIQYLTLRGFAVFVPNVRGSRGYGLSYMKQVDHDWGGKDRLDHVEAVKYLEKDARLDTSRMGVLGRSYGGYMTLELAGRHPNLWAAAIDMFGPYNLFTFIDGLPETWKTYFYMTIGHPETDHDFLVERSPKTFLGDLACPMLVIQGRNDPRVVVAESDRLVEELRSQGKDIEYLVFDDEGHDMVKRENKERAYEAIAGFLVEHLKP
jgi:pimeloyl-ACP methyl ester carboxylesterase